MDDIERSNGEKSKRSNPEKVQEKKKEKKNTNEQMKETVHNVTKCKRAYAGNQYINE